MRCRGDLAGHPRELGVGSGDDIKIPPQVLEARRAISPPIQPTFRRGSMLIRDIRLWHAGMPNQTSTQRPMIAMIHACEWLAAGTPLVFPSGTESFFDHPVLTTAVRFTGDSIDYLAAPHGFE